MLAAAAVCLPAAANASETVGSVSSGNLAISISVAPRYELRSVKAPGSGGVRKDLYSGRLCLATNSSRLAMPIALVGLLARSAVFSDAGLAGDRRRADEAGLGIWQCIQLDRPARSSHMAVDPDIHLLLVRPE